MSFETPPPASFEQEGNEGNSIRERIVFPHVQPILEALEKQFEGTDKKLDSEVVKDILYEFIEQRINRAGVYESSEKGASFPWGVTDTAELAKKLYSRYSGEVLPEKLEPNPEKRKKEFMVTSLQLVQSGSQFAFMEEPLHQAVKDLPRALSMLKDGKEPEANEIYTLGSPTNELGSMSPEFLEKIKNGKVFDEFGKLYSEFIKSKIREKQEKDTEILLYGQSMGASFATGTAKHLLDDENVTQSREAAEEKDTPFLQVRLDMPVGSADTPEKRKKWQIPVGFALDTAYTMATDPYLRTAMANDKKFLSSTQEIFTERSMPQVMSEEQVALKKQGIKEAINSLRAGTPIPEDLKVTNVVGLYDPLMYSCEFNKEMKAHKKEHRGSLGKSMVSKSPGQRTFGINMHHTMPYLRENELNRFYQAAKSLKDLKQS